MEEGAGDLGQFADRPWRRGSAAGGDRRSEARRPSSKDQLAGLTYGGDYQGPGRSPDRADAMVWALTELLLGPARAEPRIRTL